MTLNNDYPEVLDLNEVADRLNLKVELRGPTASLVLIRIASRLRLTQAVRWLKLKRGEPLNLDEEADRLGFDVELNPGTRTPMGRR
ncbi:hypothetical protein [Leptolyngbya sp. FACHB-261]|uniref:hypothetical protein n=1 Tax=Leptolyngbya sp. FACHB-261 TaxID=2692806 RepID=UPI00168621C3|nr:hypothetical protein [Leptolyngbya sp. FACHB-261]MBD2101912.1 hypothetical protein [Leptolyngbya sp. FACHB-261]